MSEEHEEPTFETWYETLPGEIKQVIDGHLAGLTRAVETERAANDGMRAQLTAHDKQAEDLAELQGRLRDMNRQIAMAEGASKMGCSNLVLARAIAETEGLFSEDGTTVDWIRLKEVAPEAFARPFMGSADGGAGLVGQPRFKPDMNTIIREVAGSRKQRGWL